MSDGVASDIGGITDVRSVVVVIIDDRRRLSILRDEKTEEKRRFLLAIRLPPCPILYRSTLRACAPSELVHAENEHPGARCLR